MNSVGGEYFQQDCLAHLGRTSVMLPAYEKLKAAVPVYISFDMDVLDPVFAPGVSHREPGGMTVREAIAHLHAIGGQIVGADLVEYNPVRDLDGMTATVAVLR